ncbi:hypothetical protein BGW38_006430, partial [Lunasporangiospora selenospora]
LINNAFNKADDRWKQAWLENRLRYVEIAENISYHIPGFRETFDWFPKEIYYTATSQQEERYWQQVAKLDEEVASANRSPNSTAKNDNEKFLGNHSTMGGDIPVSMEQVTEQFMGQVMEQKQTLADPQNEGPTGLHNAARATQIQEFQQDILGLDKRMTEANKESSEMREELSNIKLTISDTKSEVKEVREGIAKLQSNMDTIIEAIQRLQK